MIINLIRNEFIPVLAFNCYLWLKSLGQDRPDCFDSYPPEIIRSEWNNDI